MKADMGPKSGSAERVAERLAERLAERVAPGGPPGGPKKLQRGFFTIFIDFERFLGANLPSCSFPKSSKIGSEIDLERHRFFDRCWHRCFIDVGVILEAYKVRRGGIFLCGEGIGGGVNPSPEG